MTEMTEKEGRGAKIRKGLSACRDPVSYQVQRDIVIPAGTILRNTIPGEFVAAVGHGLFRITIKPGDAVPAEFKKVISS